MKKIILSILLIVEILMIGTVYSQSVTKEISDGLLRMHILANSDSEYDQKVKIKVRDYLIDYINNEKLESKEEVVNSVKDINKAVDEFLVSEGARYSCNILYSNSIFETRTYSDLAIPAGEYETLKVILGEGKGKNWWCIAYPPLCFTESVTGKISENGNNMLKTVLNDESYNIIHNNDVEYRIKFKSIELINLLLQKIN